MPTWFAIAAPYIPEIIKLARPLFTRNNSKDKPIEIVSKQIVELQTAAIQNSEAIKILASEMQRTMEAMQNGALKLENKLKRARTLLVISITISLLALGVAVYALAR